MAHNSQFLSLKISLKPTREKQNNKIFIDYQYFITHTTKIHAKNALILTNEQYFCSSNFYGKRG
jgi:hypothetical protein